MTSTDDLTQRLDVIEEEIGRLRELLVRAYEGTHRTAAELLRARRNRSYGEAYAAEPLVTVRIGSYRGSRVLVERALASVLRQSYPNWEAVVVCDGQEEETARRIAELGDSRVRCVQRPRNGPYPTEPADRWKVAGSHPFNQAVALAGGAWIAPIDQDDEWTVDHLEVLLGAAIRTQAEAVYGVGGVVLGDGTETYFGCWPPVLGDFGFQTAIYHAGLATLLYDANSHIVGEPADWNLARRMLEAGVCFEFVDRIVTTYFVDPDDRTFDWWKARQQDRGAFRAGED